LSKIYHFSSKSDPFLLVPSQISTITKPSDKAAKKKKTRKSKKDASKPQLMRLELDFGIVKSLKQLELGKLAIILAVLNSISHIFSPR
jgi:hypothetical protein